MEKNKLVLDSKPVKRKELGSTYFSFFAAVFSADSASSRLNRDGKLAGDSSAKATVHFCDKLLTVSCGNLTF